MDLGGGGCSCFAASAQRPLPHPGGLRREKRPERECPEPSSVPGPPASALRPGHPVVPQKAVSGTQPPRGALRASVPVGQPQTIPSSAALGEHPRETREWKLGLQEHRQVGERDKSPRDAQGAAQSGVLSGEDEKGGDKPEICGRGNWRSPWAPVRVLREPGIFGSHPLCPLPRPLPTGNDPGRGGETGKSSRAGSRPPPFATPRPSFLPSPVAKSRALGLSLLRSPRRGGGQQWPALRPDVGGREVHKGDPSACVPSGFAAPRGRSGAPRDGSGKGPGRGATTESWAGQGASGSPERQR